LDKANFYSQKTVARTEWWLDECAFPTAVWARLRIFSDSSADACLGQGEKLYGFDSAEYAGYFLGEDEYVRLEGLDSEDERVHEIRIAELHPPNWRDSPEQPFEYLGTY
jgi:hypothetical protein